VALVNWLESESPLSEKGVVNTGAGRFGRLIDALRSSGTVAVVCTVGACLCISGCDAAAQSARAVPPSVPLLVKGSAMFLPCGSGAESPIGFLVSTTSLDTLEAAPLIQSLRTTVLQTSGSQILVLVSSSDNSSELSALQAIGSISAVGSIFAQANEGIYLSCDYTLDDNLADTTLVGSVSASAIAAGLVTPSDLSNSADVDMVSDDPLNSSELLVTLTFPTGEPVTQNQGGSSVSIGQLSAVTALVSRSTGMPVSVVASPL
jgi:hypothetical protein